MQGWKHYLQSRTIWANLIGFAALALDILGFQGLGAEDQLPVVDAILNLIEAASFIAGAFFRAIAQKRLSMAL